MERQTTKMIVDETQKKLIFWEDYSRLQNCYRWMMQQIKESAITNSLKEIESLLKQKIEFEILHSYHIGEKRAQVCKHTNVTEALLSKGIYEAADLSALCDSSSTYKSIDNKITELKNNLYDSVLNSPMETILSKVFEIYSYCNHEIIRIALCLGYFSNAYVFEQKNPENTLFDSIYIIGKKLKYCRKSANLTQDQLSEMLGINKAVIVRYESGNIMPSINTMIKYSEFFKIDLYSIIDDTITLKVFTKMFNEDSFQSHSIA